MIEILIWALTIAVGLSAVRIVQPSIKKKINKDSSTSFQPSATKWENVEGSIIKVFVDRLFELKGQRPINLTIKNKLLALLCLTVPFLLIVMIMVKALIKPK